MGEYAYHNGQSIKIGTCENLYYLRADQAHLVTGVRDWSMYRFRFPFPDEDATAPGSFDGYDRGHALWDVQVPEEVEHHGVQFINRSIGYVVTLPCPESGEMIEGIHVHRNGFSGATHLVQQRLWEGMLVPVLRCACGARWRVPTREGAADIFESLDRERSRERESYAQAPPDELVSFAERIASRIRQGYDRDYVASLGLVTPRV